MNSVRTGPGQTAVTVTPEPRSSVRIASLNERTKDLLAAYTAEPGSGWKAAVEAMLITLPRPRSTMPVRKRLVRSTTASTLIRTISTMRS